MKMMLERLLAAAFAALGAAAFGAVMPQLPEPVFADTEVCTNVSCAALLSGVRELEVVIDFAGTESNCVQVAFGCDIDGDGDLSANETDVVIGWRAGDCFIEDVKGGRRFSEAASATNALHRIELRAAAGGNGGKSANVMCDGAAKFAEALGGDLRWLYDRGWNLAKVPGLHPAHGAQTARIAKGCQAGQK